MSEWTSGFRAALVDFDRLARSRGIALSPALIELLADLDGDALVVEREQANRIRKRRLAAVREADLLPELELALERLVDEAPP